MKLPPRSPNLNAYAERFVRTIKESCLEQMIFFGEDALRNAIREFVRHQERNHQGLDNRLIIPTKTTAAMKGTVRRRQRLGGMLNYYYRTDKINNALGNSQFVNKCSGWHTLGTVTGIGLSTAIGGAGGAEAAEANAGEKGFEFSHWMPDRWGGPRSVFNGNYVSQKFAYLTDFYRYPPPAGAALRWGPKLNPALQQILRIPWVYDGAAAGAAYGAGGAMAGRNCGCQ